jgi:uncharacterized protein
MRIPKLQEEQLNQTIQRIVEIINPLFIFCFGSRTTQMQDWGSFVDKGGYRYRVHPTYDLLIITPDEDTRHDYEIVQLAEQQGAYPLSLNCIAHRINYVNEAIKSNSDFYCSVIMKGRTFYNAGRETLLPCAEVTVTGKSLEWSKYFNQAQHFLSLASQACSCSWNNIAVFLLHQVVENACNAMIRFFTGYHSSTHNLNKLLALTETFSGAPISIFPGFTKEEDELLNLLNRSYSEARYKENFTIPSEKVVILLDRVKLFLEVAEKLHKKGIDFVQDSMVLSYGDEDPATN